MDKKKQGQTYLQSPHCIVVETFQIIFLSFLNSWNHCHLMNLKHNHAILWPINNLNHVPISCIRQQNLQCKNNYQRYKQDIMQCKPGIYYHCHLPNQTTSLPLIAVIQIVNCILLVPLPPFSAVSAYMSANIWESL